MAQEIKESVNQIQVKLNHMLLIALEKEFNVLTQEKFMNQQVKLED